MKQEEPAVAWLKQKARQHQRPLLVIFILRALQLSFQIAAFWLFSQLALQLFVRAVPPSTGQWQTLLSVACFWIALRHLAANAGQKLQNSVALTLQDALHRQWQSRQQALVGRYSSYFWQQLVLQHIPAVAQYLAQYQVQMWLAGSIPLLVLLLIAPVNWLIALVLFVTLPIVPLFMVIIGKGAASLHRNHFTALERMGGQFSDRLKGLTLLTSFNRHRQQRQKLATAGEALNRRTMEVVSVAFLSSTVLDFFATLSMALVAVFVGFNLLGQVEAGPSIDLQQGLFLLLCAPLLMAELKNLGHCYHQKAQAQAAAEVLEPILATSLIPSKRQSFSGIDWIGFQLSTPGIQAKRLSLLPGDKVLLQGPSGAGKSALLEALMGMRESSHRLGARCVMLSQKPVLLPGSLKDNLTLGKNMTDEKLLLALEQVELTTWLERLPQGLDTPMGEHPPLSGGQAQRLALARVLLHPADIVLLDEPTAHLTDELHHQLSRLLQRLLADNTVIWVTHKPMDMQGFNHHWQLNDGVLVCG